MRVLLITRYFPPLDSIATQRMYSWAKYLHREGCRVTVLTTDKSGQIVAPYDVDVSYCDVKELSYFDPFLAIGAQRSSAHKTCESRSWKGNLKAYLKRIYDKRLNERMPGRTDPWIFPARKQIRRWKVEGRSFDLIISSYGPPSAHIVGGTARKLLGGFWVADYRDLWLENVREGLWPFQLLEGYLERKYVGRADLITSVSKPFASILAKKFPNIPTAVIENGFDGEEMSKGVSNAFVKKDKKLRIVYTGTAWEDLYNLKPLFQGAAELIAEGLIKRSEIEILFYGGSSGWIPRVAEKYSVSDIVACKGLISQNETYDVQKSADILLFLEANFKGYQGILSGKIFEYLFAGPPIISIGDGSQEATGRLIKDANAGLVCNENVASIKRAIIAIKNGEAVFTRNWDVIGSYSRQKQVQRLLHTVKTMIPAQANSGSARDLIC